VTSAD